MATFKVLLDKRRKLRDETYPLVIRIYNGNKFSTISLKTYLKEAHFDESSQKVIGNHPNKKEINQRVKHALLQVEKTKLNLEIREQAISAEKIKNTIVKPTVKLNFIQFAEQIIAELRAVNRLGNANAYRDAVNALKSYTKRKDLQFADIDYEFLRSMENKMLQAGLKKNSIAAYNRSIRAIFNRAINADLIELKLYPYRKYKIKGEATAKRNITKEHIITIAKMELQPDSQLWHARNYFMLSFNLRGISIADMACIKPKDINNGRLLYKRKKTHKLYSIKLTNTAREIIQHYTDTNRTYILPIIPEHAAGNLGEERKYTQYATKTCNRHLQKIGEQIELQQKLTTYFARHSWATIAKKMGYSKDLISEALGHSFGNRITEVYLDNFDQDVIDAMNEAVCKI